MNLAIIGAGQSGILLAHSLLDADIRITLIDSGDFERESPLLNKSTYDFVSDTRMPEGVHKVGGGANLWYGRVSQYPDYVFNNKNFGWPLTAFDLESYYLRVYEILGLGKITDQEFIDRYMSDIRQVLSGDIDISPFFHCEPRYFLRLLEDLKKSTKVEFCLGSPVKSLAEDSNGLTNVMFADGSERLFDKVVVSAGAIQSTAILLRSKASLTRLKASESIGVGLMEHFDGYVGVLKVPNSKLKDTEVLVSGLKVREISDGEINRTYGFGLKLSKKFFLDTNFEYSDFHFHVEPYQEIYTFGDLYYALPRNTFIKRSLFMAELVFRKLFLIPIRNHCDNFFGYTRFALYLKGEEIKTSKSTISLNEENGALGTLVYKHRVSRTSSIAIRKSLREFTSRFNTLGLGRIKLFKWFMNNPGCSYAGPNWHPMGTLPMGLEGSASPVNSDLSLTGYPSIYILSSAIYPSGSYQNPTMTTLAFALKLSDKLKSQI